MYNSHPIIRSLLFKADYAKKGVSETLLVMTVAMFFNLFVAVIVGLSIPLLRYKYGKDPAIGTSVMLTFVVDATGFLIFLGLAKTFLL